MIVSKSWSMFSNILPVDTFCLFNGEKRKISDAEIQVLPGRNMFPPPQKPMWLEATGSCDGMGREGKKRFNAEGSAR